MKILNDIACNWNLVELLFNQFQFNNWIKIQIEKN